MKPMKKYILPLLLIGVLVGCKKYNTYTEQYTEPSIEPYSSQSSLCTVVWHYNKIVWIIRDPLYSMTDSLKKLRLKQAENIEHVLEGVKK